jgi:hypothetical protein
MPASPIELDQTLAERLARLPLAGLEREYPNHLMHHLDSAADVASPKALHPIFYGCYDWHSAVHGYWLLLRCLRRFPALTQRPAIVALFERQFTAPNVAVECAYFLAPGRASFERPYGWAWLLKLAGELRLSALPQASEWRAALDPLVILLRQRLLDFLPRQRYPIRAGTHANTAFALMLALEFARIEHDAVFADAITHHAHAYFGEDRDYPAAYEPGGDDFLSGALTEASLMAQVLPSDAFISWLARFLPQLTVPGDDPLLRPVRIVDHDDPKLGHLDGLHLSRAWCLQIIASKLPSEHPDRTALYHAASVQHAAGLPQLASGNYNGDHWLATFAMLASDID